MTGECMEVDYMSCNNGFFGGNNLWTVIILIFLLCWLGGGNGCGNVCGNGCGLNPCCGDCGC